MNLLLHGNNQPRDSYTQFVCDFVCSCLPDCCLTHEQELMPWHLQQAKSILCWNVKQSLTLSRLREGACKTGLLVTETTTVNRHQQEAWMEWADPVIATLPSQWRSFLREDPREVLLLQLPVSLDLLSPQQTRKDLLRKYDLSTQPLLSMLGHRPGQRSCFSEKIRGLQEDGWQPFVWIAGRQHSAAELQQTFEGCRIFSDAEMPAEDVLTLSDAMAVDNFLVNVQLPLSAIILQKPVLYADELRANLIDVLTSCTCAFDYTRYDDQALLEFLQAAKQQPEPRLDLALWSRFSVNQQRDYWSRELRRALLNIG